jgi:hypothetical protein
MANRKKAKIDGDGETELKYPSEEDGGKETSESP